jgi:hypothetical protein
MPQTDSSRIVKAPAPTDFRPVVDTAAANSPADGLAPPADAPTHDGQDKVPQLSTALDANLRIDKALRLLTPALRAVIETELRRVHNDHWQHHVSVADGSDPTQPLDPYAALKTILDNWQSCFKTNFKTKTRTDVSKALEARNAIAHASGEIPGADAISYLTAIRDIGIAISADSVTDIVRTFIDDQIAITASCPIRPHERTVADAPSPFLKPGKDW